MNRRCHDLRQHGNRQLRDCRLGMWGRRDRVRDHCRYPVRERKRPKDSDGVSDEKRRRRGSGELAWGRRHHCLSHLGSGAGGGTKDLCEAEVLPHPEGYVDEKRGGKGSCACCGSCSVEPLGHGGGGVCCDVGCCVQGPDDPEGPGEEEAAGSTDGGA